MKKTLSENILSIEQKINLVLEENMQLKQLVGSLELELTEQKNITNSEIEKVKNLENQIKINNIAKGNVEEGKSAKETRAKINEVIREVDRCIRYLKN